MPPIHQLSPRQTGVLLLDLLPDLLPAIAATMHERIASSLNYDKGYVADFWPPQAVIAIETFHELTDALQNNLENNKHRWGRRRYVLRTLFSETYYVVTYVYLNLAAKEDAFPERTCLLLRFLFWLDSSLL